MRKVEEHHEAAIEQYFWIEAGIGALVETVEPARAGVSLLPDDVGGARRLC